jgi:acid phosphatase
VTPPTAAPTAAPPATSSSTGRIQHVVWIAMENQDYSNIYGPQSYETSIANQYGLAEDYYATGHFSLDNYLTATSGVTGVGNDDSCGSWSYNNIFNQLGAGNAVNYVESGNTDCDHNPASQYSDLGSSFTQTLPTTFTSTTFSPKFVFVSPNKTDDGHDSSASTGDAWLSSEVPKIMATPQYTSGSMAIFIVYDESNVNDTQGSTSPPNNHVYLSVISPYTHAVKNTTQYTHCSLLRTAEDLFRVPALGCAASANSMVGHFGF